MSFHRVYLVVGGLFTLILLALCVCSWIRFKRTRAWTFEKKTYLAFASLSLVIDVLMGVVYAANVSSVLTPRDGFSGSIAQIRAGGMSHAFSAWVQSGNAHLPPLVHSRIDDRLAWQRPKAIICAVLLIAFVALSVWIWRTLIRRSRLNTSGRKMPWLLASGSVAVAASFVLMLMVIGNAEGAIAPITLTLMYG